eukprot:CAMPEP_0118717628 /NCGR_PEP_ID=MMETSP0800-20121206/28279_1 /TAXON_ID=210618 ORGANISM="Striatella unipunctata, Strain CCMP2910" /NCGR_SAMPLE_ID=MMETSP0800 /ASSEMBLY_ACC=CAM_ASM_000638 /LENGTH=302 /DNA_ID=CAMNT_0006624415 /DNA_START=36 /DNA_END=947 /DNA_ORIENTATION=+
MSIGNGAASLSSKDSPSSKSKGNATYKYQDYANFDDGLAESRAHEVDHTTIDLRITGQPIRHHRFPFKLHVILSQEQFGDIITWMPHGRAWIVLDPTRLEREVLPLCFDSPNYSSFNRIVNAWSFRRITSGPDQGAYYHEMFLRGMPHLHQYMRRLPRKGKKLPMEPGDEPNFYAMPPSNPPAKKKAPPKEPATSIRRPPAQSTQRSVLSPGSIGLPAPSYLQDGLSPQLAQLMGLRALTSTPPQHGIEALLQSVLLNQSAVGLRSFPPLDTGLGSSMRLPGLTGLIPSQIEELLRLRMKGL